MEIINKTIYYSEDIMALFHEMESVLNKDYWCRAIPKTLRVGYYTPTPEEALKGGSRGRHANPWKYASYDDGTRDSRWNRTPRLGLPRRKALYHSPLEELAATADGDVSVPSFVMDDLIACLLDRWIGFGYANTREERWDPVRQLRLRYRVDRRHRSKQEIEAEKHLRQVEKLDGLTCRLRIAQKAIRAHRRLMNKSSQQETEIEEEIKKYCLEHDLNPYDYL